MATLCRAPIRIKSTSAAKLWAGLNVSINLIGDLNPRDSFFGQSPIPEGKTPFSPGFFQVRTLLTSDDPKVLNSLYSRYLDQLPQFCPPPACFISSCSSR
jgi:hypothetical protein